MVEVHTTFETPAPRNPWAEPFVEWRLLAGHLRPQDVARVYPAAKGWPEEIAAHAGALHGAGLSLDTRAEAGRSRLHPVEEPEALEVLNGVMQFFNPGPDVPVSYAWVEIENLIAAISVSDPMPQHAVVVGDDPQSLAEFSLYGAPAAPKIDGNSRALLTLSNMLFEPTKPAIENGQLVCRYNIAQLPQPILVGYEQDRYYLLNSYGVVLLALARGVERLLCLVHYGLDLKAADMGVQFYKARKTVVNHFGETILSGDRAPLVRDFLDPRLSVAFPARASFFLTQQSIQTTAVNFSQPSAGEFPINFDA
jgi:hypothetical protein